MPPRRALLALLALLAAARVGAAFTCAQPSGNAAEQATACNALSQLYGSGAGWQQAAGWRSAAAGVPTNMCSFYGVTCSSSYALVALDLTANGVSGTLPSLLGSVATLSALSLGANSLSGTLPPAWSNLAKLSYLSLSSNQLSGSIPSSWSGLQKLLYLGLSQNALSGTIPDALGALTNLNYIGLAQNALTGLLPGSLGQLKKLAILEIGGNRLGGVISGAMCDVIESLQLCSLSSPGDGNVFACPLPDECSSLAAECLQGGVCAAPPPPARPPPPALPPPPSRPPPPPPSRPPPPSPPLPPAPPGGYRPPPPLPPQPPSPPPSPLPPDFTPAAAPPPPVLDNPAAAVAQFTLTFQADYALAYLSNASGFRAAYAAGIQAATGGVAVVSIATVTQGSVVVATRVGFPPFGGVCIVGDASACGTFLATLIAAPQLLFATQPALAALPASCGPVDMSYAGRVLTVRASPPPPAPAAPPVLLPPSTQSRNVGGIIAAAVGAGIIGPSTVFSLMACFARPLLRRILLRLGFHRLAKLVVPDVEGDMRDLHVKLSRLETFVASQRLPRLQCDTPELDASQIELDMLAPLGSGGYGVVYRGVLTSGEPVAVKALFAAAPGSASAGVPAVLPPDVRKRLTREAAILCSLNHPNVVHIFGVVSARAWLVMELCPGGTLASLLLDPDEALPPATLARLAQEAATGVAYLHLSDVAIVHGDLKADNVLLTAERSVRLSDFGLADAKGRSKSLTAAGVGAQQHGMTVAWTAPEVLRGEAKTFASDVFALGVLAWEIFERARPFAHVSEVVVINQLLSGMRPPLSQRTPERAATLARACWTEQPQRRPKAAHVACILADVLAYLQTSSWQQ